MPSVAGCGRERREESPKGEKVLETRRNLGKTGSCIRNNRLSRSLMVRANVKSQRRKVNRHVRRGRQNNLFADRRRFLRDR